MKPALKRVVYAWTTGNAYTAKTTRSLMLRLPTTGSTLRQLTNQSPLVKGWNALPCCAPVFSPHQARWILLFPNNKDSGNLDIPNNKKEFIMFANGYEHFERHSPAYQRPAPKPEPKPKEEKKG